LFRPAGWRDRAAGQQPIVTSQELTRYRTSFADPLGSAPWLEARRFFCKPEGRHNRSPARQSRETGM